MVAKTHKSIASIPYTNFLKDRYRKLYFQLLESVVGCGLLKIFSEKYILSLYKLLSLVLLLNSYETSVDSHPPSLGYSNVLHNRTEGSHLSPKNQLLSLFLYYKDLCQEDFQNNIRPKNTIACYEIRVKTTCYTYLSTTQQIFKYWDQTKNGHMAKHKISIFINSHCFSHSSQQRQHD